MFIDPPLARVYPLQRTMSFIEFLDEPDPIAFFCRVLADESAPIEQRKAAAQALRAYYHPMLWRRPARTWSAS
jgi:hypothetical protein